MRRSLPVLFLLCILHSITPSANASAFQLPRTGQTISYTAGDDGALRLGLAWPAPRFVDNSLANSNDQTVTDNLTGLIWTKDANLMKTRDPSFDVYTPNGDGMVTWQLALDYVKKLNNESYLGYSDWRLPNLNELESLLNITQTNKATWLKEQGFTNVGEAANYWSSTTDAYTAYTDHVWLVNMTYGWPHIEYRNYSGYVWPVRSASGSSTVAKTGQTACYDTDGVIISCSGTGQDGELQVGVALPSPRFNDNGDNTITDNLTGLVWSKDGNSPGPLSCSPGDVKDWAGAFAHVNCLNSKAWLGKTDWRLPNINELHSLLDHGQPNLADWLNGQGFSNVQNYGYWSSSTYIGAYSDSAYELEMVFGTIDSLSKEGGINVWPVRSGLYLSVVKQGTGSGTVSSVPAGIDCGANCSAPFTLDQSVTLTATADAGSILASWTDCDSATGNQCTVSVNRIKSVTATFDRLPTTACGSANGVSSLAAPAANLCAMGTATEVTTTGAAWNWSCTEGTDPPAKCSASIPVDPAFASIQLPQTGQAVCYAPVLDTAPWTEIPCAGTGQDGDIQAGKPWPTPRFTDNGNGAVTDNLTGLNWLKNVHCTDTSGGITKQPVIVNGGPSGWLPWEDSLTWSNGLSSGICGLSDSSLAGDWRLPSVAELASLQDAHTAEPALPTGHFFGNAWAQFYQSSTTYALSSRKDGQWISDVFQGGIGNWGKSDNVFLWPVRDGKPGAIQLPRTGQTGCWNTAGTAVPCTGTGQDGDKLRGVPWPVPRFTDNLNGTVTDRLTGLIWLKNANCLETSGGIIKSGSSPLYIGTYGTLSWPDALTWSKNLGSGVCGLVDGSSAGDWRLPNHNELQSLMDRQNYGPTLPTGHPFQNVGIGSQVKYWSSTPMVITASVAPRNTVWTTSMLYGFDGPDFIYYTDLDGTTLKMFDNFVWPVRGGSYGDSVIDVSPGSKDFGTLAKGGSAGQVITIRNAGAASRMQVNAMSIYGADSSQFTLNVGDGNGGTCGSTMPIIPPGASCTVTVSFTPTATGTKTARLRISASDVNIPNMDISLSGSSLLNGDCGTADGGTFNTAPSAFLCASGTASAISGSGPWTWDCNGAGGGTSDSCSANITNFTVTFAAGAHGTLTGTTSQTVNYGGAATAVTAIPDSTYAFVNWTEGTTVIGAKATLTVSSVTAAHSYTANFVANYGICGTSNGGTFTAAPASNLCAAGTATIPSGGGPWGWKCVSAYGGADADCSANISTYTVTPSADAFSTISPSTPFTVKHGSQATFNVTTAAGYGTLVSGCGGTLNGTTYTSGSITGDCTVSVAAVLRNANGSGSGQPSMQDALRALNAYSGRPQSAVDIIRYDVAPLGSNGIPAGNGVVDFADVILILRRIVGIGSW